jgi:hypothetical protein
MKNHYDTPEEFAKDVVTAARSAWVNGTFNVNGQTVAIKAYGKWVQRINCNCLTDGGEFRTQGAMKAFIIAHVGH